MLSFTPKAGFGYPAVADRNWGPTLVAIFNALDAKAAIGPLSVKAKTPDTTTGLPTTLQVTVSAGNFLLASGVVKSCAGGDVTVPASSTRRLWLDDAGAIQSAASWPPAVHTRLATVTTGSTAVTAVTDERTPVRALAPTEPALVVADTDSTGGTVGTSLAACGNTSTGDRSATVNNNFATLAAKVEEIRAALVLIGVIKEV